MRPELMDIKQTAAMLGLSPRSIWKMDKDGLMPKSLRICRRAIRWRRAELVSWIEAGCPALVEWEKNNG